MPSTSASHFVQWLVNSPQDASQTNPRAPNIDCVAADYKEHRHTVFLINKFIGDQWGAGMASPPLQHRGLQQTTSSPAYDFGRVGSRAVFYESVQKQKHHRSHRDEDNPQSVDSHAQYFLQPERKLSGIARNARVREALLVGTRSIICCCLKAVTNDLPK